ncbi:MAG TPA: hypothetical protein VE177_00670, partial [Candidatus Binatus sp.]|nr:hypothetical protein [Candidatus Binatus sp.]
VPEFGEALASKFTVRHALAVPPVGHCIALTGEILGRIELGPRLAAEIRVIRHSRMANATRFFLGFMLLTLFQGNFRRNGSSAATRYKSYRSCDTPLYPG